MFALKLNLNQTLNPTSLTLKQEYDYVDESSSHEFDVGFLRHQVDIFSP